MKDPSGNAAPSGGFQNLGWYSGYQYNNGAFAPQAGMIISSSPQQGAGQAVSAEVNAQTSVAAGKAPGANQAYVDAQNANPSNNAANAGDAAPGGGLPGGTSVGAGGGAGFPAGAFGGSTPALDLPGLNTSLSNAAGIPQMEADLTAKSQAFNDAQSKINDNPFLSESDRVGRIQKLTTDYNNDVTTSQNALTMAKQDVATQLSLQTQQFNINSQQATQALNEFNTLLSSGALAGASGSDIASITKATGISSSMIQAAISSQTAKDTPTAVQMVDDGVNQYAVVINTKTGAVVSKQVLGASKPTAASTGGLPGSAEYNANLNSQASTDVLSHLNSSGNISPADYQKIKAAYLSGGGTAADFNATFGGYADINRADFDSAYGFKNPTPVWSTAYPGNKIGTVITDANGNKVTVTK